MANNGTMRSHQGSFLDRPIFGAFLLILTLVVGFVLDHNWPRDWLATVQALTAPVVPENFNLWLGMKPQNVKRWGIGLFVALYGGHVFARSAMWWHWERVKNERGWWTIFGWRHIDPPVPAAAKSSVVPAVSSSLVGATEGLFFALVTALSSIGFAASSAMIWMGLKIAINWERRKIPTKELGEDELIRLSQGSAYGSLVSLLCAVLGGLICSGEICIWLCD